MYCTVRYLHRFYIYSDSLQCSVVASPSVGGRCGRGCRAAAARSLAAARDRMTSNKLKFYFDVLLQ